MACASLVALQRSCGSDGLTGGVSQAYMIAFADCENIGSTTDIYTLSSGGIVSAIGVQTGKMFVPIDVLDDSSGLSEELTKNKSTGNSYMTSTFSLNLADLSSSNRTFVQSVMNQPVVVIIKSMTGNYYAAGLNGKLELATLTGGVGVTKDDAPGYQMTFTGTSSMLIPSVDPTLIPTLLVAAT